MAVPMESRSIEELLAEQRATAQKCMEMAQQCMTFTDLLSKRIGQQGEQRKDQRSKMRRATVSNLSNLKEPLLGRKQSKEKKSGKADGGTKEGEKAPIRKGLFANAHEMKDRVVLALKEKAYHVEDLYKDEGWAQEMARDNFFNNLTLAVIALNTIWMGVETDFNKADVLCEAPVVFQIVDNLFTLYFTFEILVRFFAFREYRDAFGDTWFCFDAFLVCLMIWETYIVVAIYFVMGGGIDGGGLNKLAIFRLFRLLRLTRVARLARLLRAFPELMVLSKAMVMALRSLGATLSLLFLVIYVFAIMFTQLLSETETGVGYFENIPQTFNTLLMMGVFTEQKSFIARMLDGGFIFYLLILFYLLVSSYTVLNMLIGVICEVISDVANREREDIMIQDLRYKIRKLSKLFEQDSEVVDEERMISREAFAELLDTPEATKALKDVGVDVPALVDFADFIFPEGENGIEYAQLLETILRFRGTNTATVKDVVDMRQCILREISCIASQLSSHERQES